MPRNEVRVTITGDAEKFKKSLQQSEGALAKFSGKMKAVGGAMKSAGSTMAMGVTMPLVGVGIAAVKMAGELEDSLAMSNQVFGKSAGSLEKWANGAAKSFGMAKGEAIEAANQMGIRLRNIGGMGEKAAADTARRLTQLAGDFASAFGGPVSEASDAITAALTGEMEQLKKYGIVLNDASLKAAYFKLTGEEVTGTLTAQQKQQATLAAITEQTTLVQGDFARNADGATNSQKTLTAQLKDAATQIGTALLPVATKVVQFVSDLVDGFTDLEPGIKNFVVALGVAAAAIGPVLWIGGMLVTAIGALASPLGIAALLIGGLAGAIVAFYRDNEDFRDWVKDTAKALREKLGAAFNYLKDEVLPVVKDEIEKFKDEVLPKLKDAFEWLRTEVKPVLEDIKEIVVSTFGTVDSRTSKMANSVKTAGATMRASLSGSMGGIAQLLANAFRGFAGVVQFWAGAMSGNWSKALTGMVKIARSVANVLQAPFILATGAAVGAVRGMGAMISSIMRGLANTVKSAVGGMANALSSGMSMAGNNIRRAWNSTIGGRGLTIPNIPGFPGRGQRFEIPRLHSGGMVPGIKGSDVPAILQAGEYVISARQVDQMRSAAVRPGGGSTVLNVTVQTGVGDPVAIGRTIVDMVRQYESRNGAAWRAAS